jgi:hypothetical protein
MGGGPSIPSGPSAAERQELLAFEDNLAKERQEKARKYQEEADRRRTAIETQKREQDKRTEAERVATLEQQETDAIGSTEGESSLAQADTDNKVVNMWTSLASGTKTEASRGAPTTSRRPL